MARNLLHYDGHIIMQPLNIWTVYYITSSVTAIVYQDCISLTAYFTKLADVTAILAVETVTKKLHAPINQIQSWTKKWRIKRFLATTFFKQSRNYIQYETVRGVKNLNKKFVLCFSLTVRFDSLYTAVSTWNSLVLHCSMIFYV